MNRPEIRVISSQEESISSPDVSQSEVEKLLAKYGYNQTTYVEPINNNPVVTNHQTFEDMLREQELDKQRKQMENYNRMNRPRSISFDDKSVKYTETKYSDVDGLGLKIQIVTDMKI